MSQLRRVYLSGKINLIVGGSDRHHLTKVRNTCNFVELYLCGAVDLEQLELQRYM
jgi:hypothetical protein